MVEVGRYCLLYRAANKVHHLRRRVVIAIVISIKIRFDAKGAPIMSFFASTVGGCTATCQPCLVTFECSHCVGRAHCVDFKAFAARRHSLLYILPLDQFPVLVPCSTFAGGKHGSLKSDKPQTTAYACPHIWVHFIHQIECKARQRGQRGQRQRGPYSHYYVFLFRAHIYKNKIADNVDQWLIKSRDYLMLPQHDQRTVHISATVANEITLPQQLESTRNSCSNKKCISIPTFNPISNNSYIIIIYAIL